jgi:predicted RNA binding protein YcfA (HicA-like mRNA interferase family)
MGILANISSAEAIRAFEKLGWQVSRQMGSHIIMTKTGSVANLSVPNRRECAKGTLRHLIKTADITVDAFLALL